jgi:hypothetical protein
VLLCPTETTGHGRCSSSQRCKQSVKAFLLQTFSLSAGACGHASMHVPLTFKHIPWGTRSNTCPHRNHRLCCWCDQHHCCTVQPCRPRALLPLLLLDPPHQAQRTKQTKPRCKLSTTTHLRHLRLSSVPAGPSVAQLMSTAARHAAECIPCTTTYDMAKSMHVSTSSCFPAPRSHLRPSSVPAGPSAAQLMSTAVGKGLLATRPARWP